MRTLLRYLPLQIRTQQPDSATPNSQIYLRKECLPKKLRAIEKTPETLVPAPVPPSASDSAPRLHVSVPEGISCVSGFLSWSGGTFDDIPVVVCPVPSTVPAFPARPASRLPFGRSASATASTLPCGSPNRSDPVFLFDCSVSNPVSDRFPNPAAKPDSSWPSAIPGSIPGPFCKAPVACPGSPWPASCPDSILGPFCMAPPACPGSPWPASCPSPLSSSAKRFRTLSPLSAKDTGTSSRTATTSHRAYRARMASFPRKKYRMAITSTINTLEEIIHSTIPLFLCLIQNLPQLRNLLGRQPLLLDETVHQHAGAAIVNPFQEIVRLLLHGSLPFH